MNSRIELVTRGNNVLVLIWANPRPALSFHLLPSFLTAALVYLLFSPQHSFFLSSPQHWFGFLHPSLSLKLPFSMDDKDESSSYHGSDLSDEKPVVSVSLEIHNLVVPTVQTLGALVRDFPHIPEEQRKAWKRSVSQLSKAPPPTFKYVFIGRTGVNSRLLLDAKLIYFPRSACTSTVYEISYQESNTIDVTIVFQSKSEWLPKLTYLLEDAQNDSETSQKSKDALYLVYPHLRNANLSRTTTNQLLKNVQNRLGTSVTMRPANAEDCKIKLRDYLNNPSAAILAPWPLVRRVEIRGKFAVLASGITLVDLPGDGDIDDMRNGFADQYIKNADGFVLVVDIKRAQDDRGTHDHLRTSLTQLILDGRVVGETVVLVATHTDVSSSSHFFASVTHCTPQDLIGEDELQLNDVEQFKLGKLLMAMKELSNAIKKTKGPKYKTNSEVRSLFFTIGHPQSFLQLALEFRVKAAEKARFLANIRTTAVREKLQEVLGSLNSELGSTEQPKVFCVASRDYLLIDSMADLPLVFTEQAQTEIPDLVAHLSKTGECRRLRWATDELDRASAFCEGVRSYFSEGRHPGQLSAGRKKKLLAIITELETRNLDEATDLLEGIQEEFKVVRQCVKNAVKQATNKSPKIMENFNADGKMHWSTYRATMNMNGLYPPHDLNRDLTKEILPDVQRAWNSGITHRIPLIVRDAIKSFEQSTRTAIDHVVRVLNGRGPTFQHAVATARQSIAVEVIFRDLREQSMEAIAFAQRDGIRSFQPIVQTEMALQYVAASQISGIGTWNRMRVFFFFCAFGSHFHFLIQASNQEYIEGNAENIFIPINTHITELFRQSLGKLKKDVRAELRELTTLLRLALIEDVNLSQNHMAVRDEILQTIIAKRPAFESRKIDLGNRWRALGVEDELEYEDEDEGKCDGEKEGQYDGDEDQYEAEDESEDEEVDNSRARAGFAAF
ncbi:hypothetical protein B0H17DRAFT_1180822 [Mycena rosella]|uniref:Uncharacterized protein n=1 Tax=Mycena rosella TaxID=1033263 RepID=A0AAD7DBI2_MYCRO|nr:hypothetical protein B0H17DRAFT_1180822 [Mycena rosella]